MSARKLTPVHMVLCTECQSIFVDEPAGKRCPKHGDQDFQVVDMGYRVGESDNNYSWYSTPERAWTDRRCK